MIKHIDIDYKYYTSLNLLSQSDATLIAKAKEICKNSYSPFSNFVVAAVAILDNGEMIGAANQESEVFPSGMCAERVLLYNIQSNYQDRKIVCLAIYASKSDHPCTPCGACRQVMIDTQKRQNAPIRVIMAGAENCIEVDRCNKLLPFAFSL